MKKNRYYDMVVRDFLVIAKRMGACYAAVEFLRKQDMDTRISDVYQDFNLNHATGPWFFWLYAKLDLYEAYRKAVEVALQEVTDFRQTEPKNASADYRLWQVASAIDDLKEVMQVRLPWLVVAEALKRWYEAERRRLKRLKDLSTENHIPF